MGSKRSVKSGSKVAKVKQSKKDWVLKDTLTSGHYNLEKGKFLGEGAFGICHQYKDSKTNLEYCVKAIPRKKATGRDAIALQNEIDIQKVLDHPGVVKLYHTFEDKDYYYLLMEVVDGCSLKEVIEKRGKLTEPEVKYYILHILEAMEYIHSKGFIHRDFKLDNIFLTKDCKVKVGDFGLSAQITKNREDRKTLCGTPNYLAPEVLTRGGYSSEADLWSLGVIMFALLFGRKPFVTNDQDYLWAKIIAGDFKMPTDKSVSPIAKDFCADLLNVDPELRPTIKELLKSEFLDRETIPTSLATAALTLDPALDKESDDDEQSRKKARVSASVLEATSVPMPVNETILKFDVKEKVREAYLAIATVLKKLVDHPERFPPELASHSGPMPTKFISKLNLRGKHAPYQMFDGTLGFRYNDRLNVVRRPNVHSYMAFEPLADSKTEYICSNLTADSLKNKYAEASQAFTKAVEDLKRLENICELKEEAVVKGWKIEHLATATFPLRLEKNDKHQIFVFSDGSVQIQILACKTTIFFETKAKRITFFRSGGVRTFHLDEFLANILHQVPSSSYPMLRRAVNFSKFNVERLPKVTEQRQKLYMEGYFYYFNTLFTTLTNFVYRTGSIGVRPQ